MTRILPRRLVAAIATPALLVSLTILVPVVRASATIVVNETAQEINADGDCSLQEAIYSANLDANIAPDPANPGGIDFVTTGCAAGNGDDTIVLPAGSVLHVSGPVDDIDNPLGPTGTPIVHSTIVIEGNGARLERTGSAPVRAFAVAGGLEQVAGTGDLTIRDLHVQGFLARGGNGGNDAGGGLGAGGAIYVREASLTIENSTFEGNGAQGGNGGGGGHLGAGGGGGGLGGDGGSGSGRVEQRFTSGAGGGGGSRGNGGSSVVIGPFGQFVGGILGGGGGGTLTDGLSHDGVSYGNAGGVLCGGDGGVYKGNGADGCQGGGGGGGGRPDYDVAGDDGGSAGNGGYGGGGGGGGYANSFFTSMSTSSGGHGGFGGGGGGAGTESSGGAGGFGAGGGGGTDSGDAGPGGTFGGRGGWDSGEAGFAVTGAGGGGAGLGGAVFSDNSSVEIRNSTFTANYAVRGVAGIGEAGARNGEDAGGAIFAVDGALAISNATIAGNESTGANAGVAMYRSTRSGSAASLAMTNTIVAVNTPGSRECELIGSVGATGAGNLITNNADCPGVVATSDPLLGALAIEAPGVTPTMAIDTTSPAYDAGDDDSCESADQRGVSRPRSLHCDIGAYEYIKPSADLAVSTTNLGAAVAGADLAYLIHVDNHGPTAAQSVTVTDTLPSGTTFVSITGSGGFTCGGSGPVTCTKSLMLEGASALFTLTVHIPATATDGTSIVNAVTVASTTPDPVAGNNSASVSTTIVTRADLSVTKSGPTAVIAGTDVTYQIAVTNQGPSVARTVALNDTIPVGTTFQSMTAPAGWSCANPPVGTPGPVAVTCSIATLPTNSSASFALVVRLAPSAAEGAQLCNSASVTTVTPDPVSSNDSWQACGTIHTLADLALTQSAATTGKPGKGTATFTATVSNLGPSNSLNVSFAGTSSLFSGPAPSITTAAGATCTVSGSTVTCSWASLAVGASATVRISVPWRSSVGSVCMTGTVSAGTPDPNAINSTSSVCIGKR